MTAYAGSTLYATWVTTGGTTVLSGDFRTFTLTPTINLYDETAGSDSHAQYIPGLKNATCSFSCLQQQSGTAFYTACIEGAQGTLIVGPEGTASGKQKITIPAISMGVTWTQPYNELVSIAISFQESGARLDGAY